MKDHIKKLEDQCWSQIPCDFDMMADGLSTVRTVFDREKFAELLIDECYKIINVIPGEQVFADKAYNRGYFDGRKDAASMIVDFFELDTGNV